MDTMDDNRLIAVEIYECSTGRPVDRIYVTVTEGKEDDDRTAAINESVTRWCKRRGYDFGGDVTWTLVH